MPPVSSTSAALTLLPPVPFAILPALLGELFPGGVMVVLSVVPTHPASARVNNKSAGPPNRTLDFLLSPIMSLSFFKKLRLRSLFTQFVDRIALDIQSRLTNGFGEGWMRMDI